jgi:hypothetical protein
MQRLADTPEKEEKKGRKKGRKSQEKEEVSPTVQKKKGKKKVTKKHQQAPLPEPDSSFNLEDMLDDMEMPRGFKLEEKTEGQAMHPRLLEMDEISSIKEERQQFMEQNMEGEMSVFNKILHDYKIYKDLKGNRKKKDRK